MGLYQPLPPHPQALLGDKHDKLAAWDVVYSLNMGLACLITYWIITSYSPGLSTRLPTSWEGCGLSLPSFSSSETPVPALSSGIARLIATCVSFGLCLPYLLLFPFTPVGLAILLGIGTLAMALLDRRGDIVTTGITTAVVMVVAAMSPNEAWQQPLLRLFDAVVGIALGVICKWIGSYLFSWESGYMSEVRKETDSMGVVEVPADKLWGA
jgi:hypothetical protein